MAFIEMNIYSHILQRETKVNVLLPEKKQVMETANSNKRYPVLYVLHGYSDNSSAWIRKSTIELAVRNYEVIVVMPEVDNSFYVDMVYGPKYYSYIVEELPIKIMNFFPASNKKKDTYIMGNSMGGYGAFKIAMANPNQYAAAVSFSGILGFDMDETGVLMKDEGFKRSSILSFENQERLKSSNNYLYTLAKQLSLKPVEKPRLYHLCGTKDPLAYDLGYRFVEYIKSHHLLDIEYKEIENGQHDWHTWNENMQDALEFLLK